MKSEVDVAWTRLAERLAGLAAADSPGTVLERLVAATVIAAPRAALFLMRRGRLRGSVTIGESDEAAHRIGQIDASASDAWVARTLEQPSPVLVASAAIDLPRYGQQLAAEHAFVWIRLEGKPAVLLLASRGEDELPWSPAALGILAELAGARLEVELLRRRALATTPGAAPDAAPPATPAAVSAAADVPDGGALAAPFAASQQQPAFAARETARVTVTVEALPVAAPVTETGLAPFEQDALPQDPERMRWNEARRFARLVATDIRLYNEEAVLLGRRQRDLARRLRDQMERGRESFQRRFPGLGDDALGLLEDAYVEVLAAGDATLLHAVEK
jgi:hypothetical protein